MNAPQTPPSAPADFALQSLRAISDGAALTIPKFRIIRAAHLGMCFGVRDAIALVRQNAAGQPLTVFGELVHNRSVLDQLEKEGIEFRTDPSQISTPQVMITAHGASQRVIGQLRQDGFQVTEATCPLVHHAHQAVKKLVAEGCFPVVIGKRDHVEVRGLTGDLTNFAVVETEAEVDSLPEESRYGVAAQTTQPLDKVQRLVQRLRERFPNAQVRFIDTVCQPTKQRQAAAIALAQESDAVVVVGGAASNNTRELVETCRRFCPRVFHVQTAADLRPELLHDAQVVGLTAGTSTPDYLIDSVEKRLRFFAEN